jgi:hypothetical protein
LSVVGRFFIPYLVEQVEQFPTFPVMLSVGDIVSECGSFSGCPQATTLFPTYLEIDYIFIYKKRDMLLIFVEVGNC